MTTGSAERSTARVRAFAGLCGVSLLGLALLAGSSGAFDGVLVRTPSMPEMRAADLGIGEVEMGPDFGRTPPPLPRGTVATILLYAVLLLCPAKFVFLWALQRREARQGLVPASPPRTGAA